MYRREFLQCKYHTKISPKYTSAPVHRVVPAYHTLNAWLLGISAMML